MHMSVAIAVNDLTFEYPDKTMALAGVSLQVESHESLGIVGANGAGKSTLVNHFNGFFLAQSGSVRIDSITVTKKTQEQVRRIVGIVFQVPDDQLFMSRLYDDVAFGPQNLGMDEGILHDRIIKTLTVLNLKELAEKAPSHLSQGQKRFAAFATVLVMQPSIIVMDEPTSDLDPRNRRKLIQLVQTLDATRITVSHDLDFIWEICDRTVVMNKGRIVADGFTREILSNRQLMEENGLELPLRLQS
ncbi:MAG: ATP-binding cassette domain-containing protein [Chitinivibrionales bacterium]|nr:ATP-binding cassette domain-containing protein [Chitinivibrionales bacterium]